MPLGGHLPPSPPSPGDTWGRNVTLKLSILIMGCCTVAIGILPTYDVGPYTAGLAAPILLTILRLLQVGRECIRTVCSASVGD